MSTERTITVKAADGTLTMAELRAFAAAFGEAAKRGEDGELRPKARVGFRGGIKSITVTVPDAGRA